MYSHNDSNSDSGAKAIYGQAPVIMRLSDPSLLCQLLHLQAQELS